MKPAQSGRNYNGLRFCNTCHQDKAPSEFSLSKAGDGLSVHCKACQSAKRKMRYYANVEKRRSEGRAYYRAHRDMKLIAGREWRIANPDKCRTYSRLNQVKRRALRRKYPQRFSEADWQNCLVYWGGRCAICKRLPGNGRKLSMDHWIPLTDPDCPGTVAINIIPLCHGIGGCNNSKGQKRPDIWLTERYGSILANIFLKRIEAYFEWVCSGNGNGE